ncbi:MAG: Phosphoglycerate mutase [Polaromonas sp.]|nr:Phosphoglycerate mutase [Polaromonas sp.]
MKLWLVRHAQPLVAPGVCYGRLNMPADAAATGECARRLAALLPRGVQVISSPLRRCAQLRRSLAALRPDLVHETDARLQEMDFGRWEGRSWQVIDRQALEAWTRDFAGYPAGGTGECVAAFMARVALAFDALPRQGDAVWITHAGVIRAASLLARGVRHIGQAADWPLEAPKYGQWQLLDL